MEKVDPAYCHEVAAFLDAKNAETRKIDHLQKVSQLLDVAADTLRDFNPEKDQRLAEIVREIYQGIRRRKRKFSGRDACDHQGYLIFIT
ncbi:MerR family transcriptional regulator [Paenibacillus sp. FSL R5-0378]|uniref:MerR family transcriptional regulator n=1 Tax=Paenibacillus sp. FSL R5-0378 TaxID=2921637 RepID=UPI0030F7E5F6